jgi:hypothetical protein
LDLGAEGFDLAGEGFEAAPRGAAVFVAARDPREVLGVEAPLAGLEARDAQAVAAGVGEALESRRVAESGRRSHFAERQPAFVSRSLPRDSLGHLAPFVVDVLVGIRPGST